MHHRFRGLRAGRTMLLAALASLTLAACGSSSSGGDASTLLKQTFSGSHAVNSGNLNLSLTIVPSGSNTLTGPITLSFGGPFQSLGKGKLPASNFSISISALGKTGSLGILSTGKTGYVTLQGTSYQLPPATFQKLESSFAQIGASPGNSAVRGSVDVRHRSAALADQPIRRRQGDRRRRRHDPHPRRRQRRRAARRHQHVPVEGLLARRLGRREPAEEHLADDPQPDRRRGQEPELRGLDRQQRQDRAQALGQAHAAGDRQGLDPPWRHELRRSRAERRIRQPQSAAEHPGAVVGAAVHRVPGQAADVPFDRARRGRWVALGCDRIAAGIDRFDRFDRIDADRGVRGVRSAAASFGACIQAAGATSRRCRSARRCSTSSPRACHPLRGDAARRLQTAARPTATGGVSRRYSRPTSWSSSSSSSGVSSPSSPTRPGW